MELQAQLTALEEEVGMLKGEIKAILQEVRVAILARQNPFLSDDLDRPVFALPAVSSFEATPATPPASAQASGPAAGAPASSTEPASRVVKLDSADLADVPEATAPAPMSARRPVDLAALMVWVQECAETFSHTEFVMLVTMASYADYFDEGLKQALLDMSQQVAREHTGKASLSDFSLALKQLESIRASGGRRRQAA